MLLTDAETRAVLAAARGLAADGRFSVVAAGAQSARPAVSHWSGAVSERLSVPDALRHADAFVEALERALRGGACAVLMPGSDASLLAVSAARERLAPHALLGLPPHTVTAACLDKLALGAVAASHGLASPCTIACPGLEQALLAAEELGYPVIVKPPCSVVEHGARRERLSSVRVEDAAQLERAVQAICGDCLIQRCEVGRILSFAGVFAAGRLLAEALSRYRRTWPPHAGSASFSETLAIPTVLSDQVSALLAELGWEGLFELELIQRPDGSCAALDFNPRPYGSLALAVAAGANLPAIWCAHLLGARPPHARARPGVHYRWGDADLRHCLWRTRRGQVRAAAAVLRVPGETVHAYWAPGDPGPLAARAVDLAGAGLRKAAGHRASTAARRRDLPVVVIGAGPYGLSAAAHLRATGLPVRCFGRPLAFWRSNMPAGMILRSSRRASHISAPGRDLTIEQFERETGRRCRAPSLKLEEFVEYGRWFARRAVGDLDERRVSRVTPDDGVFRVTLQDGESLDAARVAVAAGLAPFPRRPQPLASFGPSLVSHSSDHRDLSRLADRRVVVIGGGQSALESAALLSEAGATVEVVTRSPEIRWLPDDTAPEPRRRRGARRVLPPPPPTGVGGVASGWIAAVPDVFRATPEPIRRLVAARCLAPAGSGWLRKRLAAVRISCGREVSAAQQQDGRVRLWLTDRSERLADHVLLATGFAVDVARYPFLDDELIARLDLIDGCPRLGTGLESSVPGLHFLGAPAALSFGPVMRFVVGTCYAAPALALTAQGRRQPPLRKAF